MPERQEIPILGMDTRPLARQTTGGLCREIKNLRPKGPESDPHWEAVPSPEQMKNNSGVVFDHPKKENIVSSYFKLGNQLPGGGQSRKLVLVFSDGSLEVLDPDGETDWEVILSYSFGDPATDWDADFAPVSEILAISLIKGNKSYQLLYLYNDEIVSYGFPHLPSLLMEQEEYTEFDNIKIEEGIYDGLDDGFYAYRYAFRLSDGSNISLSPPIPFSVDNNNDNIFSLLAFTLAGYSAQNPPKNYSFWKDIFTGVDVFLSGKHDSKKDVLLNGLFYNILSFASIDKKAEQSENTKTYSGKYEDISANRVFEVDQGSFHRLSAKTIHSYNSRLLLGNVAVDFAEPPVSIYGFFNPDVRVVMSPVEYTSEQYYYQGSDYETYTVRRAHFTLTALYDSVLPETEVSVTNVVNGQFSNTSQEYDSVVRVNFFISDESLGPPPDGPLSFDVDAQAFTDLTATTPVGEPFSFSFNGGI